ncbi:hypothetical protein Sipo8835_09235 [Streptomyces ipomoeae]|uniref:Uncharacterized protein n=1 Tax=Streptomyces ipomoeae TaxID=103232 RepID=A0AAE8W4P0_9ACTN|nr:hypothetical protein [Streptomyces ipomoeae]TQE36841.1 hypothetical protein Sipo8835_09235 [Streptomyces ipomoeae]
MNILTASRPHAVHPAIAPAAPPAQTSSVFQDAWLPRPAPRAIPAGDTFDAVRVTQQHGELVLQHLQRFPALPIGAVLADQDQWWFFVPAHFDNTPWPRPARYLTTGSFITVPPPEHTRAIGCSLGWIQHGAPGREFTSPLFLRPVLDHMTF